MTSTLAGGFIPGVISMFSTNLIFKAMSREGIYYTVFNFVVVVLTTIVRRSFIKNGKNEKALYPYVFLCVIFIACYKTMLLHLLGHEDNEGRSIFFINYISNNFNLSKPYAVLLGNLAFEDIDISITTFLAYHIIKLVPLKIRGEFYNIDIWQGKLPEDMQKNIDALKVKRSFKKKLFIIVNTIMFTSIITSFIVSFTVFKEHIVQEDLKTSNITMQRILDKYDLKDFQKFEEGNISYEYLKFVKNIKDYTKHDDEIACVYVFKNENDKIKVIANVNTKTGDYAKPGTEILKGKSVLYDSIISNDINNKNTVVKTVLHEKMFLNTKNILDGENESKYYIGCGILTANVDNMYKDFAARFLSVIIILIVSEIVGMYWFINNNIVRPIKAISYIVGSFKYETTEDRRQNFKDLKKLEITTEDEVENLYNALLITMLEENRQSTLLSQKKQKINDMQRNLISALAELVESRDNDTGEHIKKTAEYVRIIANKMKERQYYTTQLTDKFIENITYAAPLHDIGKIQVSDTILLKPGKLTDEEFEKMKEHTIFGGQILKNICDYIPDIEYLHEARFMAEYHHEKWNGKGYPHNLSGESIPLSARIMAVADVFDALVSKRVYKDAFSFEKAVSIITEESGQQFDPLVVDAFIKALDEIKVVKEKYD